MVLQDCANASRNELGGHIEYALRESCERRRLVERHLERVGIVHTKTTNRFGTPFGEEELGVA